MNSSICRGEINFLKRILKQISERCGTEIVTQAIEQAVHGHQFERIKSETENIFQDDTPNATYSSFSGFWSSENRENFEGNSTIDAPFVSQRNSISNGLFADFREDVAREYLANNQSELF